MAQDGKKGIFASLFGPRKQSEEELDAELESRQKIENRIREVLVINDTPGPVMPESADRRPANPAPVFGH